MTVCVVLISTHNGDELDSVWSSVGAAMRRVNDLEDEFMRTPDFDRGAYYEECEVRD